MLTITQNTQLVIGADFGTDSVRTVLTDCRTDSNHIIAKASCAYPRWMKGEYCQPERHQFRQHPSDYLEALEQCINTMLADVGESVRQAITGLAIATTGSTIIAVDSQGHPLCFNPMFADNPNAMFILWKDHTANAEADRINQVAAEYVQAGQPDYLQYVGGLYSSEWFWSKILHIARYDKAVFTAANSWVEHCDWLSAWLTGQTEPESIVRSRCAAGHKALWHEDYQGLPPNEFWTTVDPVLEGINNKLYQDTQTCDRAIGCLSEEWAQRLGLSTQVKIAVGSFDAHAGAVGAGITPYTLTKVIRTSTCDILIAPPENVQSRTVQGICGQVDGSVIPGMIGMEAGQSAFGDVFNWLAQILSWSVATDTMTPEAESQLRAELLQRLTKEAQTLPLSGSESAVDWFNGRRSPDANHRLTGALAGLHLGTQPAHLFRALVEATAFGAKQILHCFESQQIAVKQILALGGIPKKSPYIMQTLADVLEVPVHIVDSAETCALGASIHAATAAGLFDSISTAQAVLQSSIATSYEPRAETQAYYRAKYDQYCQHGQFIESSLTHSE